MMFSFYWPFAFLLLPLPFLIRLLPAVTSDKVTSINVPFLKNHIQELNHTSSNISWWKNILPWLFLVTALARPQFIDNPISIPIEGRSIQMAIDISGSMEVEDMKIEGVTTDRLTAVKYVATEFIKRRVGDKIGLILFGEQAYIQTPITFDRKTVTTLLNEAAIGFAGKSTAIGDSIGLAVKKSRRSKKEKSKNNLTNKDTTTNKHDKETITNKNTNKDANKDNVLILLTDGQNTAGVIEPLKAAELAKSEGLKIYTIGIGADEMIVKDFFGSRRVNPSAELDEKTLTKIAETTGGKYFRARDTKSLEKIYDLLDELEPINKDQQFYRPVIEWFYIPMSLFILSFFATLWTRKLL